MAGHRGVVGSALLRRLRRAGHLDLLTAGREELDLRDQSAVNQWLRAHRPDYIFPCAGTVGGILANSTRPAESNDNFDLESSHVVPALIRRFHEAKLRGESRVTVWGTGTPRRELLHVDDLADALLFLMEHYDGESHINVGTGEDLAVSELAEMIRDLVAPGTELALDPSKPDGTPRKLLDVSRVTALGWRPSIGLAKGLAMTYRWFTEHHRYDAGANLSATDRADWADSGGDSEARVTDPAPAR